MATHWTETHPNLAIDGGFHRRSVEHALEIQDVSSRTIRSLHTWHLVSHRPSRFFERRYEWTGTGIEKDPLVLSGKDPLGHARHRLHGPVIRDGITRIYLVDLGRTCAIGEEELVQVEHLFVDVEGTFRPFLTHKANEGCEEIRLRVAMPLEIATVVRSDMIPNGSTTPLSSDVMAPTALGGRMNLYEYTYHIRTPILGTTYRITWDQV